jgi:hypothetical protein
MVNEADMLEVIAGWQEGTFGIQDLLLRSWGGCV